MRIDVDGDQLIVYLEGEIDHHRAGLLREEIDEAIDIHRPLLLTLDFGGVTFMDSSGIGLVMGRWRLLNEYGGICELDHIPPHLRKVMRLAGLEKLANFRNS